MTGAGYKTLTIPRLSSSFQWSAQEVSKLGKSCVYILSDNMLNCDFKVGICFNICQYNIIKLIYTREK